jgi:hypothetical protein
MLRAALRNSVTLSLFIVGFLLFLPCATGIAEAIDFGHSRYLLSPEGTPTDVAVGDLDGDGDLDLAVGPVGTESLGIALNSGYGSFSTQYTVWTLGNPYGIEIGDLDGDGDLDIVTRNIESPGGYGLNHINILLNNGTGSFTRSPTPPNTDTFDVIHDIALGDLDGDDDLDLAILRETYFITYLFVYENDGAGGFTEVWQDLANSGGCTIDWCVAISVAMGDLDGDGNLDLVVTEQENAVRIRWGNGDGSFTSPLILWPGSGYSYSDIKIADLNKDGNLDVAMATGGPSNGVEWFLGNGDRTFQPELSEITGDWVKSLAVGDFDLDGNLDFATANGDLDIFPCSECGRGDDSVSILRGDGTGHFQFFNNVSVGYRPESIAAGDFDGDGFPDLVTANLGDPSSVFGSFSILLNNPGWDGEIKTSGGIVYDSGSSAAVSIGSGVLDRTTDVFIRVEDSPPTGPSPPGYFGAGTKLVTIVLNPNPGTLPPPGATIVLPLISPLPVGEKIDLWKIDPDTGAPINTHIWGTVDPGGTTATFEGVRDFSTFVGLLLECDTLIESIQEALAGVDISEHIRGRLMKKVVGAKTKFEEEKFEDSLEKLTSFRDKLPELASKGEINPVDRDLLLAETDEAIACVQAHIGAP